ncbi:TIGR02611 family protein [Gordonia humi]|uniref:Uncharacterized protein (TIGR02611 family) n=1 Tax=Gordonia humi TaxID=686429 RepID=A0A840EWS4_9ACTN|nr:TIGR02611 family protein [Gordonia humi]MBB4137455.1 uncharacterized protein (TIGR02611 family) [Gordonia humi]
MLARLGTRYRHLRHNHRYGFVLRYVTIIAGVLVTAVGIIAIPLPGPGWAIVFLGLLILSQELEWAARLRRWVMATLNSFYQRFVDGSPLMQAVLGVASTVVVVAILWLVNAFGIVGGWIGVHSAWLQSPLFG